MADTKTESAPSYPKALRELMREFDAAVDAIRVDIVKVGRNVSAAIRARKAIQNIRKDLGLRMREAILAEKHRVYGARDSRRKRNARRRKECTKKKRSRN